MKNNNLIQKNKGFTLIELLVVISIISLLSTVVLASLAEARNKAEEAKFLWMAHEAANQAAIDYGSNNDPVNQLVSTIEAMYPNAGVDVTDNTEAINNYSGGQIYFCGNYTNTSFVHVYSLPTDGECVNIPGALYPWGCEEWIQGTNGCSMSIGAAGFANQCCIPL